MSDVTRQVGGALGVAVIGSITSLYASKVSDQAQAFPTVPATQPRTRSGERTDVASSLPSGQGVHLTEAAATAYTDAMSIGFTLAGIVALVAAVAVLRWLPARHRGTVDEPVSAKTAAALSPTLDLADEPEKLAA